MNPNPIRIECPQCGTHQTLELDDIRQRVAAANPQAEAPTSSKISTRWKVIGALIVGGLTIASMLTSIANSGINYRQMRAIESLEHSMTERYR